MSRLQKKCLIAVAGTHLLLVVVLFCSGFLRPKPKPDDSQVLDVIPANIIDAAFRSTMRSAQPPPPAPPVAQSQPPTPAPTPPPPKPIEPVKTVEPVQPPEKIQPDDLKPVERPETKPKETPHKIEVDLKPVIRKTTPPDNSQAEAEAEAAERAAKKLQQQRLRAIRVAASAIRNNTASSTTVEMPPGENSAAYADYASVVKTVYTEAWNLPETSASDDANVKVSVTIASDGEVTDAHIVEKSGDSTVDSSVQKTLDRVRQIEPFPPGSTDKERTYIINFNLKAKRMLG
jgi:TonB family protein